MGRPPAIPSRTPRPDQLLFQNLVVDPQDEQGAPVFIPALRHRVDPFFEHRSPRCSGRLHAAGRPSSGASMP